MKNPNPIALEDGDYLEHSYKDVIRVHLTNYEQLWRIYIGHDGNGRMPEIKNLPHDEASKRQEVGERLYTCLESLICIYEITEDKLHVTLESRTSYIKMLNLFIAFNAHCGRIRDNFSKLGLLLYNDEKDIIKDLEDIYQRRNTVLHGKKVPMRIDDSLTIMPTIGGAEPKNSDWHEDFGWHNENLDLNFLQDYLATTKTELFKECNSIIAKLLIPIKEIVCKNSILIPKPIIGAGLPSPSGEPYVPPVSGSNVTYNYKVKFSL